MGEIIEIVRHTEHLIPALRVELFSYVALVTLTVALGLASFFLKRA